MDVRDSRPAAPEELCRLLTLLAGLPAGRQEAEIAAEGARALAALAGADVAVLVRHGRIQAAFPEVQVAAPEAILDLATRDSGALDTPLGPRLATALPLGDGTVLVVARSTGTVGEEERRLLEDAARALAGALALAGDAREQREARAAAERQARQNAALLVSLRERSRLLERLTRIQRSISHRAPLQEVFDAVTAGASELLGLGVVGLRLLDPDDQHNLLLISSYGIPAHMLPSLQRTPVGVGAGGRAVVEARLVVVDDYQRADNVHEVFAADNLQAAMAAPVHQQGRVVGSLTVASYDPDRRFSHLEQEALLAFAEHTSVALTDASTVAQLREAQHAKDLFLAMVSHELKTPLTVIMGTLRTLERRGPALADHVRNAMLGAAFERGRDLERLIDRLLQGARAELVSHRRVARLRALVDEALQGFDATERLVLGQIDDVVLVVDVNAVRGVLGILVENALAHAPKDGAVTVEAGVEGDQVLIAVRNPGELPPELATRDLFAPFQRGATATSPGIGLGLSIAWRLAGSAGGRMEVAGAGGQVVFTLRLPFEAPDGDATDDGTRPAG